MTKHVELIRTLRRVGATQPIGDLAADALEDQAKEIESLRTELERSKQSALLIRDALHSMKENES